MTPSNNNNSKQHQTDQASTISSNPPSSCPSPTISVHSSISQKNDYPRIHPIVKNQSEFFSKTYLDICKTETEKTLDFTMSNYASSASSSYSQGSRPVSYAEINQMLQTIQQRRVNTLTELRRIEKTLSGLEGFTTHYVQAMTDAWSYYVNSNNFLNELRGLTRQYPFSTEMLDNAKIRVFNDSNSSRSWNFAWLLLSKIKTDGMIQEYATRTAHLPAMWGGIVPDQHNAAELAKVLILEWTRAVDQLLRHWSSPPTTH